MLGWVDENLSGDLKQGAVFEDPDGKWDGVILFYEGEIRDGTRQVAGARLFAFYLSSDTGTIEPIEPTAIWDLAESSQQVASEDIDALKAKVMPELMPALRGYKDELAVERKRQAKIKEKYGLKSLNHLIVQLDGDLISLYDRRAKGENVDRVVRNKEEQKQDYEDNLKTLELTIAQEGRLTPSTAQLPRCDPGDSRVNRKSSHEKRP